MMALQRFPARIAVTLAAMMIGSATSVSAEENAGLPNSHIELLESAGFDGGVIVVAGFDRTDLLVELVRTEGRIVHGLSKNPRDVAEARRELHEAGLSGRGAAAHWSGRRLPYAEDFVNLLLTDACDEVAAQEISRVLVPRGIAFIRQAGRWSKFIEPWPEGMDDWTHIDHGPDGNPVSLDAYVGPPRQMQWIDGPAWSKKHRGPRVSATVTANGRLFMVQDETPTSLFNLAARWVLIARDAFNGVVLWRRDLPRWTAGGWGPSIQRDAPESPPNGLILGVWGEIAGGSGARDGSEVFVASGDRLFLPLELQAPVSALDATTGQVLRTYEGLAPVEKVVASGNSLLICGKGKVRHVAIDTGEVRWEIPGGSACVKHDHAYLARLDGTRIRCVDLDQGAVIWEARTDDVVRATRGNTPLDRRGKVERKKYTVRLQAGAGVVLVSTEEGKNNVTYALSADSGNPLWCHTFGGRGFSRRLGPFIIDNAVWSLDPTKGVVAVRRPEDGDLIREIPAPGIRFAGHHPRCYQARATSRYIIGKERGADFVDLESGAVDWNNWVRGPCVRGVLPANGLLYAGQHSCRCYTSSALHGFLALAPRRTTAPSPTVSAADDDGRLVRGPAFGSASGSVATATIEDLEWPTYRHDAERSGSTPTRVGDDLELQWTSNRLGRLSAPVVTGGRVLVSSIDQHTVYALNARNGDADWHRTVGGRVDSPPTVVGELVLFGCRDGWVYCLRINDGELVWRFRAAPSERFVGADGQIESAWATHGSVLVKEGVAYFVAGRSSFLDGGMHVYGLDALTGEVLHAKHLFGPWPGPEVGAAAETPNRGFTMPGALPDILVADDDSVYLRELQFDATLKQMVDMKPNYYKSPELTGENRGGDHKYWDNILEGFRHAAFTSPEWFHRSFFQNFPGRRLYCTTGLLDGEWHRRMYWSYGQIVGQYITFRGSEGYAVQVFATSPREGGLNSGQGYVVYAGRTAELERSEKLFALPPDQSEWRVRLSIRPIAMMLAGDRLLLAGPPDFEDPTENLAAIEGQREAELLVLRTDDGVTEATYTLNSPPIYDGIASVSGRLYVCTMDGRVACLAAP